MDDKPFVWYGTWTEFDAEVRHRWIDSSERLGLDSDLMTDGGRDDLGQPSAT
jgi:hypothetical protein